VIKAKQLTRRYGDFLAVDRVDFSIEQGEIVGLLGHNGAGKTTIMKMLAGYLEPSAGRVEVDGIDVAEQPKAVQRNLGYLSESLPLYQEMSVIDYLEYASELRGVAPAERPGAVRDAIEATELEGKAFDPIATLSRGYRQRVGVAQAILHKPRFLVLDEPTNGLDPSQTQHMRELIRTLAAHATILLSTHIMQEVSAICDRAMILRNGRLVLDETLATLRRAKRLLVTTDAGAERVGAALRGIDGIGTPELVPGRGPNCTGLAVDGSIEPVAAQVVAALVAANIQVFAVAPEQRDLETVFREVSDAGEAA
jgi:gliding motility-associated transport system ATP-binding protein